ncbi:LacI family DNA-binding transcriptional regulator [Klebsiella sp. BIGb0407]|uniref:LacI family DNA-binding transcriptional regulator n=1 Tax=Klebsiella sp. BIGb0407 TaxID=2940603 RepID=UPI00216827F3|nr:LacI family DNA-binding transcriptional regulator [Klebsiella sp. BIGb0407]MCS3432544.1 DNA-binding LacI/PurR family transcriptional regulator [Klebsiella sp. BIGb0407]
MSSLKAVAQLANVSLMTVSRAINTPEKLNPDTLVKVQLAIKQLNYVPNISALKIRGARATPNSIGVLALDTVTTPFSVDITLAIEETARAHGWHSFVINMLKHDDPEDITKLLLSHRPSGIIYTTMGLRKVKVPTTLLNYPCVLANCESDNVKLASYIPDDRQGQYDAVQALIKAGYRKPLCLHLPYGLVASNRRRKGLEQAFRENNIDPDTLTHIYIEDGDIYYLDIPKKIISNIIDGKSSFDSIICCNDRMAFVVYQTLLSHNIKIPDDIAVVGYDNMVGVGNLFIPALSTVQLPHYEIGRMSALHIINSEQHTETIKINSDYLARDSL